MGWYRNPGRWGGIETQGGGPAGLHWRSGGRQELLFKQWGQQADRMDVGVGREEGQRVEILVCSLTEKPKKQPA